MHPGSVSVVNDISLNTSAIGESGFSFGRKLGQP